MKTLAFAVAVLALANGAAQAADLILEPPDIEYDGAVEDWSGFYAGVFGGYGIGSVTSTNTTTLTVSNVPVSGGLIGINAGFNHQMDSLVLGAEGEVAWSGIQGSKVCDAAPAQTCSGGLTWLSSVRARAGFAVDTWMLYTTLGVAAAAFNANTTPPSGGTTGTFSGTTFGWTAGLGAEVMVAEDVSLKAEYAYYALGPVQAPANTIGVSPYDLVGGIHTAKLGINFSF